MGNAVTTEFDLKALLDQTKRETMLATNCHAIGTIQKFNETAQTVEVSINYKKVEFGKVGDPPTLEDYPLLIDCPVIVLTGGAGGITFPIAVGDTCLVLFNDRDINDWFSSGQIVPPASPRLHSFADAIALVGLHSLKNPIAGYSTTKASFFLGTTKVTLGSKVKIENALTTLLTVLNGLIDVIEGLQTVPVVPATPAALGAASIAALEAYKATLGGLLE